MGLNLYSHIWSNQYTRHMVISIFLALVIAGYAIVLLQASTSCVDENGCFKDHCDLDMLNPKYKIMLKESHNTNKLCATPLRGLI